ncbi:MAG: efflux RND transporter periplasmic adaptor subunit [Hyphomicrobiaceae bacterium]
MRHIKVLLTTGLLLAMPVLTSTASADKSQPPVPVIVQTAQTLSFRDRVEALGTLRSNESVALTAVVADKVTAIKFEDGDRVEEGQTLVEMTTAEETAVVDEARSTLQEAKAQFERAESLTKRKLSPETVFDQRRRDYATARARVAAMEARLSDRILKAPFAGRMGLRNVSVGSFVGPGDVIARIEDDSVMKLDFSVPSTFISTLKPGLEIVANARGFANDEFRGTVASIDNRIDEITRTIKVRAILPNPDRKLVPGLLMNVSLFKNPRLAVAVAEEALVPIGTDTYVFVVDENKMTVARRRIETGARQPGFVEVTNGLKAGELVVTDGTMIVRPGTVVTILSKKDAGEAATNGEPAAASEHKASSKPAGRT